jgi:deoxyadenosine/deoxycytidine kinase
MTNQLILLAGNIGSGKTTLAELLGQRLGWVTAYESVADNPYLPNFYKDMRAWAFHLQVYFLGHRAQQHLDLWSGGKPAIIDRSIYEDAYIFARALKHMGNFSDLDFLSYQNVFNLVIRSLPAPDLLIYLDAPVPILMQRIQKRARNIETGITAEYLNLLESFYQDWIMNFSICPVLNLDTSTLDYSQNPEHLEQVIAQISEKINLSEKV